MMTTCGAGATTGAATTTDVYKRQNKGFTVRVDRPDLPPAIHQSETALEDATDWSYVLDNSGSLEQLREGAVALFDDAMVSFPFGANR